MAKKKAYGAVIDFCATTDGSYVALAGLKDIKGPNQSVEAIDVSTHDGDGWTEKIAGIKDGGEVTFDVELDLANGQNVSVLQAQLGEANFFRIRTAESTASSGGAAYESWKFQGFISAISPDLSVKGSIMGSVTITVAGAVTYFDGA